jgi:hypothetical protein
MNLQESAPELEAIHCELMRESFEALLRLDRELKELERLAVIAATVARSDLEAVLAEGIQVRIAKRAILSGFIADSQPTQPEVVPEVRAPVSDEKPAVEVMAVLEVALAEPVPALEPQPKPITIEHPNAAPKPTPTLTRPAFDKRCKHFHEEERRLFRESGWSDSRDCLTKSLVCECRALIEAARELDRDASNLWTSMDLLRQLYNEHAAGDFFGFNTGRIQRVQTWSDLAQAFALVPIADESLNWLDKVGQAAECRDALLIASAAVESWLHRIGDESGLGAVDFQQKRLHTRIDEARGATWIPWWKLGPDQQPTSAVLASAQGLPALYRQSREKIERSSARAQALDALSGLADALLTPGEIALTLYPAVTACLEAGIPPSNKDLVGACFPYRQSLADIEDPALGKLLEYVDKHANKMLAKYKALPDLELETEEPGEEGYAEILASVRAMTTGKRVLFIGGKTQKQRVADLKKELAAGDVIWPDSEPDTNAESFLAEAKKADLVCYVVKWSRHSYKRVIDFAKGEGKSVVTLKAGVGPRRIVHDLHEQLVKSRLELL